ncbi:MAG: sugar-binding protein [Fervidobacterium sp.]|uniref:sugar ABC transporter substrate-binding protein n=1 Tax=Fervidobacterium TaxID=2422 RepID=UPI0014369EF0|nr:MULTISPECIES: sugar-binding protein [Fervidobacterium]NPU89702.1 sugar-binding protein [Fervidobacterium sp.]QIV79075.1 sugar ABC transporter substrate-binding protein [Fervidobacterium pennivorans subsp. keratinolyticus]
MKKWLLLAVFLALMIASVLHFAVDVGVVLPTNVEPRWVQDETRFREALKTTKYSVEILFSQGSPAKERENVEALIAKGIKVLIICPHDAVAAAASAELAKKAGVYVISYDRLIMNTEAVDYYVTFDSVEVGRAMGRFLVEKVKPGTKNNPLYLYAGALSDNNSFLFFQGAWEILQPKIADGTFRIINSSEAQKVQNKKNLTRNEMAKIIGQITTNWDFNVAKRKAEDDLTRARAADKGTVYILAPNDGTARAIADAFRADKDVKEYYITGQDAEKASVQYIIDGKQSMTVFKDVRILVKDAINAAQLLLEGKKPTTTAVYDNGKKKVPAIQSEIQVVTKDNVKQILIDSGYYSEKDFIWPKK